MKKLPMLKLQYLQSTDKCALHEPKLIRLTPRNTEIEHFRQATVFGSIFSVFHWGKNRHENGGMFGKHVLSVAASFSTILGS